MHAASGADFIEAKISGWPDNERAIFLDRQVREIVAQVTDYPVTLVPPANARPTFLFVRFEEITHRADFIAQMRELNPTINTNAGISTLQFSNAISATIRAKTQEIRHTAWVFYQKFGKSEISEWFSPDYKRCDILIDNNIVMQFCDPDGTPLPPGEVPNERFVLINATAIRLSLTSKGLAFNFDEFFHGLDTRCKDTKFICT